MHNLEFETGCTLPLCKKWITRIWNILHCKKSNMFYDHSHNSWFTSLSNLDVYKSIDQSGHYGSFVRSTNVLYLKKFSMDTLSIEFLSLLKHYICHSLVSCYNHIHYIYWIISKSYQPRVNILKKVIVWDMNLWVLTFEVEIWSQIYLKQYFLAAYQ